MQYIGGGGGAVHLGVPSAFGDISVLGIYHEYRVTQKNKTHIFLSEIHKFNSSSFVFSGYEVDSVHERLKP